MWSDSYSADIWSLGCIAHELCTLKPVFFDPERTKTEADVRALVRQGQLAAAGTPLGCGELQPSVLGPWGGPGRKTWRALVRRSEERDWNNAAV